MKFSKSLAEKLGGYYVGILQNDTESKVNFMAEFIDLFKKGSKVKYLSSGGTVIAEGVFPGFWASEIKGDRVIIKFKEFNIYGKNRGRIENLRLEIDSFNYVDFSVGIRSNFGKCDIILSDNINYNGRDIFTLYQGSLEIWVKQILLLLE